MTGAVTECLFQVLVLQLYLKQKKTIFNFSTFKKYWTLYLTMNLTYFLLIMANKCIIWNFCLTSQIVIMPEIQSYGGLSKVPLNRGTLLYFKIREERA